MTKEEFDAAVEGCRIERDLRSTQCYGGWYVVATTRYVNDIGSLVASVDKQGVCVSAETIAEATLRFLANGDF